MPIRRAEAKGVVMDGDSSLPGKESEGTPEGEGLAHAEAFPLPPPPPAPVDASAEQEAPLPTPPPPPSSSLLKRALIALGAFVVVGGIAALAIAFLALRGTGDVIDEMVPGNSTAYVTVYLDPALKQKLNLRSLAKKFPDLADSQELDRRINQLLDQSLSESGLTAKDIRPWLGSQVAVVVRFDGQTTHAAALIASKDDGKARDTLAKLRTGPEGSKETWKEEDHGGVTVSIASRDGEPEGAYAIVDHTVLLGQPEAINDIIDTSQGKTPSIQDSATFAKAVASLPKERLALAYVDFGPLIGKLQTTLKEGGFDLGQLSSSFGQLDAFTGLGATLSAQPDGIAFDLSMLVDTSKLNAQAKELMTQPAHQNSVLAFTPQDAYGVLAASGFRQTVQAYIDEFRRSDPTGFAQFDAEVGLSKVVDALSGDFGIEVSPGGASQIPAGALLIGTSDESGMRAFLQQVAELVDAGLEDELSDSTFQHETYRGVDIVYLSSTDLSAYGVSPAYAVTQGTAILASSVEEVKQIVDAKADGPNLTSAPNLVAATDPGDLSNNGMMYLDLEAILREVRSALGPEAGADLGPAGWANLDPLKALLMITRNVPDETSYRVFLLIG